MQHFKSDMNTRWDDNQNFLALTEQAAIWLFIVFPVKMADTNLWPCKNGIRPLPAVVSCRY